MSSLPMPYSIESLNFAKQQKATKICTGKELLIRPSTHKTRNCLKTGGSKHLYGRHNHTPSLENTPEPKAKTQRQSRSRQRRLDLAKRKLSRSINHPTPKIFNIEFLKQQKNMATEGHVDGTNTATKSRADG
ncbi:hypothetical protein ISN44_As12g008810 [Arabidopsis suecica]|uniref:Uncharacterized protein n=1 Tax=Arabidopsis suecica TaxID=45249 RepID=A0A8T1YH68_ARASU|nr:hypothetical protein ISN44_As12g008810 [Arabidopsis suecica]